MLNRLVRLAHCLALLIALQPASASAVVQARAVAPVAAESVAPRFVPEPPTIGGERRLPLDLPSLEAADPISETNRVATPTRPPATATPNIVGTARANDDNLKTPTPVPPTPTPVTPTAVPPTPTTQIRPITPSVTRTPEPEPTATRTPQSIMTATPSATAPPPTPTVSRVDSTPVRPAVGLAPDQTANANSSPEASVTRTAFNEGVSALLAPTATPALNLPPVPAIRPIFASPAASRGVQANPSPVVGPSGQAVSPSTPKPLGPAFDPALASWEETISLVSVPPSALTLPPVSDGPTFVLAVPYRSQLDGTRYERANCGPASLAMVLEAFGVKQATSVLRDQANRLQGTYGYDDGIALDYLARIGDGSGLTPIGLYGAGGGNVFYNYKRWSVDEVREQVLRGNPVVTLARYQALPGNGWSQYYGDHYIVITGLFGRNFVYNDAAFMGSHGYARLMSENTLLRVWDTSSIPRHAVAFAAGRHTPLKQVEINKTEASREALLAVAAKGDETLVIASTGSASASTTGVYMIGADGQIQVFRRELWQLGENSLGLVEANSPTELRRHAPFADLLPSSALQLFTSLLEPNAPEGAPPDDAVSVEPALAPETAAPAPRPAVNPVVAILDGLFRWLRDVASSLPIWQVQP